MYTSSAHSLGFFGTDSLWWRAVLNLAFVPAVFELHQNNANPFNPSTSIAVALPKESHVVLSGYDMLGQEVAKLLDETMDAISHTVIFDGLSVVSGVLFYRITAGKYRDTKRMVFMK